MKKTTFIFILFFIFGCSTTNYTADSRQLKYSAAYGILKKDEKTFNFFVGESDVSLKAASSIALRACNDYIKKHNLKYSQCFERSIRTPDGFKFLWAGNQKLIEQRKKIKALRIKEAEEKKIKEEKERKNFLNAKYGEICKGGIFKKGYEVGSKLYQDCLIKNEKKEIAQQKELEKKLANMTPVERREYNCENAFKFRRGSNDFNQCVFKLYTTELELEKLELQKQVALANQRAAEAQAKAAASDKARADAIAKAQIAAANAQSAAAQSTNLLNSLSMMQMSLNLLTPQRPAPQQQPRFRTTCSNVGGFLSCF